MKELFFNFIYLFKAPANDSKLVSIFEMADLFYQSTPDASGNIIDSSWNVLNEELFYDKLRDIIQKCYYKQYLIKENENIKQLILLLKNNHFIKKSL
jgi:hypothetical protein